MTRQPSTPQSPEPRTAGDFRELARLNHSGTHSCTGACLAEVVAAFEAEAAAYEDTYIYPNIEAEAAASSKPRTACPVCAGEGRVYRMTPTYEAMATQANGSSFGWTGQTHEWRTCHVCSGSGLLPLAEAAAPLDGKWLAQAISNVMGDRMVNGADLRQADEIAAEPTPACSESASDERRRGNAGRPAGPGRDRGMSAFDEQQAADDLAWATITPRKCRHLRRWRAEIIGGNGDMKCLCGRVFPVEVSRRGRNNRSRGNAIERDVAKQLGLRRVGQYGGPEDVSGDAFIVQVKSGKSFPERIYRWLKALPGNANQTPIVVITDAPGPGHRRRALVVLTLEDWVALHGPLSGGGEEAA